MITHTIIFSFDGSVAAEELDRFLAEVRELMLGPGRALSFSSARTVRVPSDDHAPVMVSSAIAQMAFSDIAAMEAASNLPDLERFIASQQQAHPYKLVWANHDPLRSEVGA